MRTYVARQPIFDRERKVYAYELLFRSGPENFFSSTNPDLASGKVIHDGLAVFGLAGLLGGKKAFINVTRNVLVQNLIGVLPAESTVAEILETVQPEPAVLEACHALKSSGYLIALDDFVFRPELAPLLALADIVKIDFVATPPAERGKVVEPLRSGPFRLLAEKVETKEDFRQAVELGFSLFQGYFFCKPEMVAAKDIPAFKLNIVRFLHEIHRPGLDLERLDRVIRQDVSLSVKLLRFLNSAAFAFVREVTSIRHALMLLGERPMKKWATLVAMTSLGEDHPQELLVTCLVRARLGELLGPEAGLGDQAPDLFLVGLLSALDVLLGRPLAETLAEIPVSQGIKTALLKHGPPLGPVYELILAAERADWAPTLALAVQLGLTEERLAELYGQAVEWAELVFRSR
jgi:c-di-GMP-related signal transduction protein